MSAVQSQVTTLGQLRQQPEEGKSIVRAGFTDLAGFELMQRGAKALAASTLVPQQFQGNLPNCLIALEMAQRIGASPLMVMQNLYIVHGRPGWSAKFLIASFNQCGRFSALRFEWVGERNSDAWGCRAWATEKVTGEKIVGPLITIGLAKKEGWVEKPGSKWKTIPELMLTYRAAAWLVNTHAPEISMGLNSAEELGDVYTTERGPDGQFSITSAEIAGDEAQKDPQPSDEPTAVEAKERAKQTQYAGATATKSAPQKEQDAGQAGPTLADLLKMVERGNIDDARALADDLTADEVKQLDAAIAAKAGA